MEEAKVHCAFIDNFPPDAFRMNPTLHFHPWSTPSIHKNIELRLFVASHWWLESVVTTPFTLWSTVILNWRLAYTQSIHNLYCSKHHKVLLHHI
jgi:hypothetical protein